MDIVSGEKERCSVKYSPSRHYRLCLQLSFTIVFSRCLVFLEPLNYYELPISFTFSQMIVLSLKNASLAFPPL